MDLHYSTVVSWYQQGIGSRIPCGYQNLRMLKSHSLPSVPADSTSVVAEPADEEPADTKPSDREGWLYIYWKKSMYKWTRSVQTLVIEGSTTVLIYVNVYGKALSDNPHVWKYLAFRIVTHI